MNRPGRCLWLAAWTLILACSGGRDEAPGSGHDEAPSAGSAGAQGGGESSTRGTVPMKIAASVGGKTYQASGPGECASSAEASIYQVPAALWHATWTGQDGSEVRRLDLTVWRPKTGKGDMVGLSLDAGGTTHRIATVKGGEMTGTGSPNVRTQGAGGVLAVAGTDDHGDKIVMTVECERFDEVVAEGG